LEKQIAQQYFFIQLECLNEFINISSWRINRLLFAGELVLFASSQQGLQHALARFSSEWDHAGKKISAKNTGIMSFQKPTSAYCKWAAINSSRSRSSSNLVWHSRETDVGNHVTRYNASGTW